MTRRRDEYEVSAKKEYLTLETVVGLAGGQAKVTIDGAITAAIRDLEDRGLDKKPREVHMKLIFSKMGENVVVEVEAQAKLPAFRTSPTIGTIIFDGNTPKMEFNPHSPDSPNQGTMNVNGGE